MNIIVIMTDTFRYDHLGFVDQCPWWQVQTPHLDAFASKCVVMDRAYQSSFPTIPQRTDMFTGRLTFPYRGWTPLPAGEKVLAQYLTDDAGYVSMLICDTPHLVRDGHQFDRGFLGWDWIRGQEGDRAITDDVPVPLQSDPDKIRGPERMQRHHYRWRAANWKGEEDTFVARTMRRACDWLDANHTHEKFFLYVDTFDPHEPWDPPQSYVDLYDPGYSGQVIDHPRYDYCDFLSPEQLRHTQALYSGECTLVDTWMGKMLAKVESLGLMDNTAILVISDHGHYIGDFGRTGKNGTGPDGPWPFYDVVPHEVCMWYVPGVAPRRENALVQPVDVFPTVLELAGMELPEKLDGASVLGILRGEHTASSHEVVITCGSLHPDTGWPVMESITDGTWTLHYRGPDLTAELYNLEQDPAQQHNVYGDCMDQAKRLHAAHLTVLEKAGTDIPGKIKLRRKLPKAQG